MQPEFFTDKQAEDRLRVQDPSNLSSRKLCLFGAEDHGPGRVTAFTAHIRLNIVSKA